VTKIPNALYGFTRSDQDDANRRIGIAVFRALYPCRKKLPDDLESFVMIGYAAIVALDEKTAELADRRSLRGMF